MKVYHGSTVPVPSPDTTHSRKSLDFGSGFYVTPIYEQARRWAEKFSQRGQNGVVSVYDFDCEEAERNFSVRTFETYSEEWLDMILECRSGNTSDDFDIVIGGVANDKVFNTVELYFDDLIDKNEALKRLRYEKPNLQICLRTQKAIDRTLRFERSEEL